MKQARWLRAMATILVGISMVTVALPQSFTGTLSGRVVDQNEAVIPKATVILKNTETGLEQRMAADEEGNYAFTAIKPAKYELSAEASGFSKTILTVVVTVAASLQTDIKLSVGAVSDVVNVTDFSRITIDKSGFSPGEVVDERRVQDLPTLTRDPYELVALIAGGSPSSDGRGVGFAFNGQRSSSGNYILDGGDNTNLFDAGPAQAIPLDAVKEFRVLTNSFSAEYGRSSGFVANVISKSGSNDFHGSIYEYNRNSALGANTFDGNASFDSDGKGLKRPVFNRNQFGFAVGGPIKPKKVFFFGSLEPIIVRSIGPSSFFVPTQDLLKVSSPVTQAIFQKFPLPSNLPVISSLNFFLCPFGRTCDGDTGAGFQSIHAYDLAVRTGPRNEGAGAPQDTFLATGRVDYNINDRTQVFGRYAFSDQDGFGVATQPYSAALDDKLITHSDNILLDMTNTWTSHLVTESRILYGRFRLEIPATGDPLFPTFDGTDAGTLPTSHGPTGGVQNFYQFYHTASLTHGDHVFKFGGQYEHIRDNRATPGDFGSSVLQRAQVVFDSVQGFIDASPSFYRVPFDPKGAFFGQTVQGPFSPPDFKRHFRYNEFVFFFQDTWQINKRLTLSPGLRWEYYGVLHSPNDEKPLDVNFYYGPGNNIFERIANGSVARTIHAAGDYQNHFYKPDYKNFAPRLGLAYDLLGDGKTVLRAGAGIYYDRAFGSSLAAVAQNLPSYGVVFIANSTNSNFPLTQGFLQNPYSILQNLTIDIGRPAVAAIDQNFKTAYTASWNLGLERNILNKLRASINYIGSSSSRLYILDDINRSGSGAYLGKSADTRLNDKLNDVFIRLNSGHSNYHALQLALSSNYFAKAGLQFDANYTWSHSIDNNSSLFADDPAAAANNTGFIDVFNPNLDKGDSDFDRRHRFSANFVWDIPIARNADKRYARLLLGGWAITGVLSFQTGQPYSIVDRGNPDFAAAITRPTYSGSFSEAGRIPDARTPNNFLLIPINSILDARGNCIADPAPFGCSPSISGPFDGVLSRNAFRRPGTQFHNLAVMKSFTLPKIGGREDLKIQLRAEFYNVFNHANLYVNSDSLDVANNSSFTMGGLTGPGVTARRGNFINVSSLGASSFIDNRQVVIAVKFIF